MTDDLMSLHRMQAMSWVYVVISTLGAWYFHSLFFAWSVLAGGLISTVSFWVSHSDLDRFFQVLAAGGNASGQQKIQKTKAGFIVKFWVRIVIIGIVLLVLIKYKKVNVFGLILGLSTVVFAITFTAVSATRRYFFSGRR